MHGFGHICCFRAPEVNTTPFDPAKVNILARSSRTTHERSLRPSTSFRTTPPSIGTRVWIWTPSGTVFSSEKGIQPQRLETPSANWSQHLSSWRRQVVHAEKIYNLEVSNLCLWCRSLILCCYFIHHHVYEPFPVTQNFSCLLSCNLATIRINKDQEWEKNLVLTMGFKALMHSYCFEISHHQITAPLKTTQKWPSRSIMHGQFLF